MDIKKKTIVTNKGKTNKFWTEANYTFWYSANDLTVYEYTFKNSYNKLSGSQTPELQGDKDRVLVQFN